MEQKGEYQIPATVEEVWEALQDVDVLKDCIDGCQSMEKSGDDGFKAVIASKVGPVRAKMAATIQLANVDAPHSYTLFVNASGGASGFGKGQADVTLQPADEGTLLTYQITGNVGGRLAQIGQRLIHSVSKSMADRFFSNFSQQWK